MLSTIPPAGNRLAQLTEEFVEGTRGVTHAVVAADSGLAVAASSGLTSDRADQLAALASGLLSLSAGACRLFDGGMVTQVLVETQEGVLFVTGTQGGACTAAFATAGCDMGEVGFELVLHAQRTEAELGSALHTA